MKQKIERGMRSSLSLFVTGQVYPAHPDIRPGKSNVACEEKSVNCEHNHVS